MDDTAAPWPFVERLTQWLDDTEDSRDDNRPAPEVLLLRLLKISEEVGEVSEAVIGATGQNPRKGTTHTWDDVRSELCDVILTAMVALRTLTPEAEAVFGKHVQKVAERSLPPRTS
ncbi:MazG-like family protein [Streptomyces sp. KLOTTS4A1]|uniref:MazG-like family protein n=1 Tax=Streptomyces sp. KLOTTS4A1 TaxID=3390996 RepID=UPI0039F5D9FC